MSVHVYNTSSILESIQETCIDEDISSFIYDIIKSNKSKGINIEGILNELNNTYSSYLFNNKLDIVNPLFQFELKLYLNSVSVKHNNTNNSKDILFIRKIYENNNDIYILKMYYTSGDTPHATHNSLVSISLNSNNNYNNLIRIINSVILEIDIPMEYLNNKDFQQSFLIAYSESLMDSTINSIYKKLNNMNKKTVKYILDKISIPFNTINVGKQSTILLNNNNNTIFHACVLNNNAICNVYFKRKLLKYEPNLKMIFPKTYNKTNKIPIYTLTDSIIMQASTDSDNDCVRVNVHNLKQKDKGIFFTSNNYTLYKIIINNNITLLRRYKDFEWLSNELLYLHNKETIVPVLPRKQFYKRFTSKFINKRLYGLNYFINQVYKHPILSHSIAFQVFCSINFPKDLYFKMKTEISILLLSRAFSGKLYQ